MAIEIGPPWGVWRNVTADFSSHSMGIANASVISLDNGLTFRSNGAFLGCIYGLDSYTVTTLASSVAVTGGNNSRGLYALDSLSITNGLTGSVTVTGSTSARGLEANNGTLSIVGGLSGTVTAIATAADSEAQGLHGLVVTITDGVSGTVTGNGKGSGTGIYSESALSITGGLSGDVEGFSLNLARGISGDGTSLAGGLSGTVAATSTGTSGSVNEKAYGITGGYVNGGDANTPLVITGTGRVLASGYNRDRTAAIYNNDKGAVNVKVEDGGTLSATLTSSGVGYAVLSGGVYADRVELVTGCNIVGDFDLGAGTDTITLSGTTGSTTLASNIYKTEFVNVTGGNWTLDGVISDNAAVTVSGGVVTLTNVNSYTGGTSVNGGTLLVNGTIVGDATVASGGTLGGSGYVGNLTNNGTVAPGSAAGAIGTLTATGRYTQNAGSTLNIQINDSGSSDKINTKTAIINGGTVAVAAASGTYHNGDTYRFLTATDGVSGRFTSVTEDLAFFDVFLLYGADYVSLLLTTSGRNYVDEARTFNQYAVAGYLDAQKGGATGDFYDVLAQLNTLNGDGARAAFDAMSGEIYGSLVTISIENNDRLLRAIARRKRVQSMTQGNDLLTADMKRGSLVYVNCSTSNLGNTTNRMSDWTTWFDSYGVGASIAGNGNASGLSYSTGGLAVGMERYLDEYTLLGFGGGYSASSTTLDRRSDRGSIDGGQLAVYTHRDIDSRYLTGIAAYGYNSYNSRRNIDFAAIDRTATANYNGSNYSAYLEAGRNIYGRIVNLQPFAALEYIGVQQNGFAEEGANSIDLRVHGLTTNAMRGFLGTRVLNYYRTNSGRLLTLDASVAWRHEFLNENRIIDASFVGQTGGAFAVSGINVDRDAAIIGTGLNYAVSNHLSVYANYDLLFSRNYAAHAGLGGLQYAW